MSDYFICPHCGARVNSDAIVCPECGSDETTGWAEDADYVDLYPPDDEPPSRERPWGKLALGAVAVIVAVSAMAAFGRLGLILGVVFLVVAGAAALIFKAFPETRVGRERELYHDLLLRAGGDRAMVDRWIDYERSRMPDADEIMLMQRALYRWKRDNR